MVLQTDKSSLLQLKDSLRIKETQIAIPESELKRTKEENSSLSIETLICEVHYDTNTTVNSVTKRPTVIKEVYTVSKKLYEESVREYEILLHEASIENRSLSTRNSNLKLLNENLEKEKKTLKAEYSLIGTFVKIIIIFFLLKFNVKILCDINKNCYLGCLLYCYPIDVMMLVKY
jgi:hypothetical protein